MGVKIYHSVEKNPERVNRLNILTNLHNFHWNCKADIPKNGSQGHTSKKL